MDKNLNYKQGEYFKSNISKTKYNKKIQHSKQLLQSYKMFNNLIINLSSNKL